MFIAVTILFVIAIVAFWMLNLLSLPGNWLVAAATTAYWYFLTPKDGSGLSPWIVVAVVGLALVAELVEFAASSMGAAKAGGSKRAAVLAIVGSFVGAIAGAAFGGSVVPIIGVLIGALLVGGLGALMGAILGETLKGRSSEESWQVGKAAFWGRIFGSLAKLLIGAVAVATVIVAVCIELAQIFA